MRILPLTILLLSARIPRGIGTVIWSLYWSIPQKCRKNLDFLSDYDVGESLYENQHYTNFMKPEFIARCFVKIRAEICSFQGNEQIFLLSRSAAVNTLG
jgi:hypothetical protein